jgi:hypothetical protein
MPSDVRKMIDGTRKAIHDDVVRDRDRLQGRLAETMRADAAQRDRIAKLEAERDRFADRERIHQRVLREMTAERDALRVERNRLEAVVVRVTDERCAGERAENIALGLK